MYIVKYIKGMIKQLENFDKIIQLVAVEHFSIISNTRSLGLLIS